MTIKLNKSDRFELSGTSKGNQVKWYKDGYYIKSDSMGYESFAEVLVSELLLHTDMKYDFIDYTLCTVEEEGRIYNCCKSLDYLLNKDESFISIYRILQLKYKVIDIQLNKYKGKDLLDFVVESVYNITNLDIKDYLGFIAVLDALILNEDRHLNNINLINNNGVFKLGPIFDNGLSLLSDVRDYSFDRSLNDNMKLVRCKPFSINFEKQVSYFDETILNIDYNSLCESIEKHKDLCYLNKEYRRATTVLLKRLKMKEGILWRRN